MAVKFEVSLDCHDFLFGQELFPYLLAALQVRGRFFRYVGAIEKEPPSFWKFCTDVRNWYLVLVRSGNKTTVFDTEKTLSPHPWFVYEVLFTSLMDLKAFKKHLEGKLPPRHCAFQLPKACRTTLQPCALPHKPSPCSVGG